LFQFTKTDKDIKQIIFFSAYCGLLYSSWQISNKYICDV